MSTSLLGLIVLFPLMGSVILGFLYLTGLDKRLRIPLVLPLTVLAPAASFLCTFLLFLQMPEDPALYFRQFLFTWFDIGGYAIHVSLMGDRLALYMALFITFIGSLIHLYATGYMRKDEGFTKFFAYFHLFMASMLILVLGENPMMLFVGWEGVGLCSYLLISYFHTGPDNVMAGNKAFILNRVGDFGFLLGILFLFFAIGHQGFDFADLAKNVHQIDTATLTVAGILLFVGAMGKSAQIPLYTWLPDAMAGPTPVSALIHAATMVTAGVYMVARFGFVYDLIPDVGLFIAYVGMASALLAAVIATQQTDIKKILAYSTMSQLGYMFIAVGLGHYDAGLFHTFTHAFFKALLFLGAGSVLYALHHEQNIFNMGGLKKRMPATYLFMGIGTLALAGLPPFAGFFSKDMIMMNAFADGHYALWAGALITVGLTAYYMSRLMTLAFLAPPKHDHDVHTPTRPMQGVLAVLAGGSILAGFIGVPEVLGGFNGIYAWFYGGHAPHIQLSHAAEYSLMALNVGVAVSALWLGYTRFKNGAPEPTGGLIANKFYVDEAYDLLFVKPTLALSRFIDEVIDHVVIDKSVQAVMDGYRTLGRITAYTQNANLRLYILYMLAGSAAIFSYLLWLV